MTIKNPVIKFSIIVVASISVVFLFVIVIAKLTTGDKRVIIIPDVIDDSKMSYSQQQQCDCWYRAEEGDIATFKQGLGCNILVMDKINKTEVPECLYTLSH